MTDERQAIDWHLTTWEGARRAALRRWAALPLEEMVAALEEMQATACWLASDGEPLGAPEEPHDPTAE